MEFYLFIYLFLLIIRLFDWFEFREQVKLRTNKRESKTGSCSLFYLIYIKSRHRSLFKYWFLLVFFYFTSLIPIDRPPPPIQLITHIKIFLFLWCPTEKYRDTTFDKCPSCQRTKYRQQQNSKWVLFKSF